MEGRVIAEHRLVRLLGRGGMAEVWEVLHLPTGSTRALKLLGPRAGADLAARFQREGEAQARIGDHPAVARVFSAGREPDGTAWLAMELLPRGDLAARLRQGPLPPRLAARIAAALARGLSHVHAGGVLHRDLKPANVLFDEQDQPRLADFGLARLAEGERLTRTGELLGTPAYAAPEQVDGRPGAIGPWTDVYGMGALLYHMLAGQPPFPSGSLVKLLRSVLTDTPAPVSQVVPAVPPALERLALQALEKDPTARPPSAAAMAEALEAWLEDPRGTRRRGWIMVVLALALVPGLLALGAAWLRRRPESTPEAPAAPGSVRLSPVAPVTTAPRVREPPRILDPALLPEALAEYEVDGAYREAGQLSPLYEMIQAGDAEACLVALDNIPGGPMTAARGWILREGARHGSDPRILSRLGQHVATEAQVHRRVEGLAILRLALENPRAGDEERGRYGEVLATARPPGQSDEPWLAEARDGLAGLVSQGHLELRPWLGLCYLRSPSATPAERRAARELLREHRRVREAEGVANEAPFAIALAGAELELEGGRDPADPIIVLRAWLSVPREQHTIAVEAAVELVLQACGGRLPRAEGAELMEAIRQRFTHPDHLSMPTLANAGDAAMAGRPREQWMPALRVMQRTRVEAWLATH